jgi:hypothetical protein
MASLNDLFEQFIRERIYEKNITPKTDRAHRQAWTSFPTNCKDITTPEQLNKAAIISWLEARRVCMAWWIPYLLSGGGGRRTLRGLCSYRGGRWA